MTFSHFWLVGSKGEPFPKKSLKRVGTTGQLGFADFMEKKARFRKVPGLRAHQTALNPRQAVERRKGHLERFLSLGSKGVPRNRPIQGSAPRWVLHSPFGPHISARAGKVIRRRWSAPSKGVIGFPGGFLSETSLTALCEAKGKDDNLAVCFGGPKGGKMKEPLSSENEPSQATKTRG